MVLDHRNQQNSWVSLLGVMFAWATIFRSGKDLSVR
jgi:hypothetical protein